MTEKIKVVDSKVVDIEAYRPQPHVNIQTSDGNVHVYPLAFFEDVARGVQPVSAVDPNVLQAVISDWLKDLNARPRS